MPPLERRTHEAFAQGLARGLAKRQAYAEAGYGYGSPKRIEDLVNRKGMAERVEELRVAALWGGDERRREIFEAAMDMARSAAEAKTGAAFEAAQGLLAEAARAVREAAAGTADGEPRPPGPTPPELTKEEWIALFAAPGP